METNLAFELKTVLGNALQQRMQGIEPWAALNARCIQDHRLDDHDQGNKNNTVHSVPMRF